MKAALTSKWSLDYRAMAIASAPTLFIIPLSEWDGTWLVFWQLFLSNLLSLSFGLGVLASLRRSVLQASNWLLVLVVAIAAGAIRGATLWWMVDFSNLPQPPIESRVFFSATSWVLTLLVLAQIQTALGSSASKQEEVRKLLITARQKFASLEEQKQWLRKTQVSGLDRHLAAKFVSLLDTLNQKGQGPKAFKLIAKGLREAARGEVRAESKNALIGYSGKKPDFFPKALGVSPNPNLVFVFFTSTSILNSFRIGGVSADLVAGVSAGIVLWAMLRMLRKTKWHLLAAVPAGVSSFATFLAVQSPHPVGAGVAAGLWALTLILVGSLIEMSQLRIEEQRKQDEISLANTEAEIEWLSLQMEVTNLEIAKYLHSILQTRLMSHALLLERGSGKDEATRQQLIDLLTNPMSGFGEPTGDFRSELSALKKEWELLIALDFDVSGCDQNILASETLLVIREAVANASSHGLASKVVIRVTDEDSIRTISIEDNGIGPTNNPSGLGSMTFDALSTDWSISQAPDGGSHFKLTMSTVPPVAQG